MSDRTSRFGGLQQVPIHDLVATVVAKLRHSTLDELGAIFGNTPVARGIEDIAAMIVSLPEKESKLDAVLNAAILRAVEVCDGNASAAARLLGMDRMRFGRRLARARRMLLR